MKKLILTIAILGLQFGAKAEVEDGYGRPSIAIPAETEIKSNEGRPSIVVKEAEEDKDGRPGGMMFPRIGCGSEIEAANALPPGDCRLAVEVLADSKVQAKLRGNKVSEISIEDKESKTNITTLSVRITTIEPGMGPGSQPVQTHPCTIFAKVEIMGGVQMGTKTYVRSAEEICAMNSPRPR